eukprot:ANDGO_00244.mRNA.1 hypothetical protein
MQALPSLLSSFFERFEEMSGQLKACVGEISCLKREVSQKDSEIAQLYSRILVSDALNNVRFRECERTSRGIAQLTEELVESSAAGLRNEMTGLVRSSLESVHDEVQLLKQSAVNHRAAVSDRLLNVERSIAEASHLLSERCLTNARVLEALTSRFSDFQQIMTEKHDSFEISFLGIEEIVKALSSSVSAHSAELYELKDGAAEMISTIASLSAGKDVLSVRLDNVDQSLQAAHTEVLLIQQFSECQSLEISGLRESSAAAQSCVDGLRKQMGALERQLQETVHSFDTGLQDLAVSCAKKEAVELEIASIRAQVLEDLNAAQDVVSTMHRELVDRVERLDEKETAEVLRLSHDIHKLAASSEIVSGTCENLDSRLVELLGKSAQQQEFSCSIRKDVDCMRTGLASVEENANITSQNVQNVRAQLSNLSDGISKQRESLEAANLLAESTAHLVGVHQRVLDELKSEMSQHCGAVAAVEHSLRGVKEVAEIQSKSLEEEQFKFADLVSAAKALELHIHDLQAHLHSSVSILQRDLGVLSQEIVESKEHTNARLSACDIMIAELSANLTATNSLAAETDTRTMVEVRHVGDLLVALESEVSEQSKVFSEMFKNLDDSVVSRFLDHSSWCRAEVSEGLSSIRLELAEIFNPRFQKVDAAVSEHSAVLRGEVSACLERCSSEVSSCASRMDSLSASLADRLSHIETDVKNRMDEIKGEVASASTANDIAISSVEDNSLKLQELWSTKLSVLEDQIPLTSKRMERFEQVLRLVAQRFSEPVLEKKQFIVDSRDQVAKSTGYPIAQWEAIVVNSSISDAVNSSMPLKEHYDVTLTNGDGSSQEWTVKLVYHSLTPVEAEKSKKDKDKKGILAQSVQQPSYVLVTADVLFIRRAFSLS